jgi:hypothetical protein
LRRGRRLLGRLQGRVISTGFLIRLREWPSRYFKLHDLLREGMVVGVRQLDHDFVRSRRQAGDYQRLAARVCPDPGAVVCRHVEMPDPWRYGERGGAEHRKNLQIFGAVLNDHDASGQLVRLWRIDDDLRRRQIDSFFSFSAAIETALVTASTNSANEALPRLRGNLRR